MAEEFFTIETLRDACLAGDAAGWNSFSRSYSPLALHLLQRHFRQLSPAEVLPEVFISARADHAAFWRSFTGSGAKEFLLHFRRLVMAVGRARRGPAPETRLELENFSKLLKQFPQLQRQMLLLALRRYRPEEIRNLMKCALETAVRVGEQAAEKLRSAPGEAAGESFLARDYDALFARIEEQRGADCLSDRVYVRIEDGQISWRDREAAERHSEDCLYCLNRFAEYHEVYVYFRDLPPADDETVGRIASRLGLPIEEPAASKSSLWRRLLGG